MSKRTQEAITLILSMNNDELSEVTQAVKTRRTFLARDTARSLQTGDRVHFDSGRRGRVTGVVQKINIKNVLVRESNSHTTWRVPAHMLTRYEEITE